MAKRVFSVQSYTPTAVADTTNLTNLAYQAIGASGASAGLNVMEVYIGGVYDWNESRCFSKHGHGTMKNCKRLAVKFASEQIAKLL